MTRAAHAPTGDTLFAVMTDSHERLERVFDQLLEALAANAPDARALWTELDHGLLAHMEAEERFMLPELAKVDRDEAIALVQEHGTLREQLLELGVAVDLHCIRLEQSRAFVETLRAHAGREERLLYRWADQRLDASAVDATRRHVAS